MKKDMTTFEMAQAAYENPGKVFVGHLPPNGYDCISVKYWEGNLLNIGDNCCINPVHFQKSLYLWNEKVEPRKWSGEYEYVDGRTPPIGHDTPFGGRPKGCAHYRVKWEAEEVL